MNLPLQSWMPITQEEVAQRGWDAVDVVLLTGDAYVDHPSFGTAVIGRILEHEGFRVAILPQPNWRDDGRDFKKFGKPRLFFGVSAGCMDSMVNHYTANKRLRSDDAYTPGDKAGFRPDYPTIVYTQALKKFFPDTPVVLGGIEASLRRFTHYDYWKNSLLPSILTLSGADLLIYGLGEKPILEIAQRLDKGEDIRQLTDLKQTAYLQKEKPIKDERSFFLHAHERCLKDKKAYAANFKTIEEESNKWESYRLIQDQGASGYLVVNPPHPPLSESEIDHSFDLPYTRLPHPKYKKRGVIPAYEMIRHSVNIHRGCFGGCAFCTISAHQGKQISSRSEVSILKEVDYITQMEDFKGYLSDLGGPSANMYRMGGKNKDLCRACSRYSCLHPHACKNLISDHGPLLQLYKKVAQHPKVKKCFIGSGIRYDLFDDQSPRPQWDYIDYVIRHCVSGRLKVAPEHTEDKVLDAMRKPLFSRFIALKKHFDTLDKNEQLHQQLIPYFISSHPLCRPEDMQRLAQKTRDLGYRLEAVQDFTPTPMTLATEMYYSGYHPYTLEKVYCAQSASEKQAQNRLFFDWKKNKPYDKK